MDILTLKLHNSFQNKHNRKHKQGFALIPLIFKLEQEVLKFHDICFSWSSTNLETNFLNVKNKSFEAFSQ